MSNSFFGGHRGASFILVKCYDNTQQLKTDFMNSNCEVAFGEYAGVSDTGDIYRRMPYVDSQAQKVGTFTLEKTLSETDIQLDTVENIKLKGTPKSKEITFDTSVFEPGVIVNEQDNTYTPNTVEWVTLKDSDDGLVYIGFKFPYTVFKASAEFTREENQWGVKNTSDNPFFQNLIFTLPEVKDGTSFSDLRVITANDDDEVKSYEGQIEDRENHQAILIYTSSNGSETENIYLGKYNMVENITINDGKIKIKYYNKSTTADYDFIYTTNVEINETNGTITTNYNKGEPTVVSFVYTKSVEIITKTINERNHIYLKITNSKDESIEELFEYPTRIYMNSFGALVAQYNNNEEVPISGTLNSIENIKVTSDYHLVINHKDTSKNTPKYKGEDIQYRQYADLGCIKDNSGMLIGTKINVTEYEFKNKTYIINKLNSEFSDGGIEKMGSLGKIITVIPSTGVTRDLYCYDIIAESWFLLCNTGDMGGSGGASTMIGTDLECREAFRTAPVGTIWFVTEEIEDEEPEESEEETEESEDAEA